MRLFVFIKKVRQQNDKHCYTDARSWARRRVAADFKDVRHFFTLKSVYEQARIDHGNLVGRDLVTMSHLTEKTAWVFSTHLQQLIYLFDHFNKAARD